MPTMPPRAPGGVAQVAPPALIPNGPGSRPSEPIEVCLAKGAQERLAQLHCANGSVPTIARRRNVGPRSDPPDSLSLATWDRMGDPQRALISGEVDYHIIDLFEVDCAGVAASVYVDAYHCS